MNDSALFSYSEKLAYLRGACLDSALVRTDLAVLAVMLDFANRQTRECFPSITTIVRESKVPKTTVIRAIKRLEAARWITTSKRQGAATEYQLTGAIDGTGSAHGTGATWNATGATRVLRTGPVDGAKVVPWTEPEQKKKKNRKKQQVIASRPAERFAEFYAGYPKKESKPAAEKAWKRHKLDSEADAVIADVKARLATGGPWSGLDRQFIPLPATYLNGRRWEDEWASGSRPAGKHVGAIPREQGSEQEIEAANRAELARFGLEVNP
ncbi:helix-turn-helix domain-containing protein [Pseudoxanthomonas mexicana]